MLRMLRRIHSEENQSRILTFNDNLEFFCLNLEILIGARSDLTDPRAGISQLQMRDLNGTIKFRIGTFPSDSAGFDVNTLAYNVGIQVGRLPSAKVDLAIRGTIQNYVIPDLLRGWQGNFIIPVIRRNPSVALIGIGTWAEI